MNARLSLLSLALLFLLAFSRDLSAETLAQTVRKWGLIGPWSLDCSLAPDRDKGAVLAYEITPNDRVVHRRDFGDIRDENEVISAEVSSDGMLNLRVYFPSIRQARDYGFMLQPDDTLRAIYNRDQKGEYTIKDGKFAADGRPTPPQHKCKIANSALVPRRGKTGTDAALVLR